MTDHVLSDYRYEVVHQISSFDRVTRQPDVSNLRRIGQLMSGAVAYASPALIDEVSSIHAQHWSIRDSLYHATSSAALPGTARRRALLSSKRLYELGEPIVTGEITTAVGAVNARKGGLDDVYASYNPADTGYAKCKEGEHPVVFGLNKWALLKRLGYINREVGDGMCLGPEVPLDEITSMAAPLDKLPETREWARQNCPPNTLVHSQMAATVLNFVSLDHEFSRLS